MSELQTSALEPEGRSGEDSSSALFAQLVIQQANMAMMLLGKVAHPKTGDVLKDIEGARLFIDQLEMLESKTKGNLSKEESALLKQSLMSVRLAFVEAVESAQTPEQARPKEGDQKSQPAQAPSPSGAPTAAEEHRKKFKKKY